MATKNKTTIELPVIALRGIVLFPDMTLHFDVAREASVNALKNALDSDGDVFFVAQKDVSQENPTFTGLYNIGIIGEIKQILRLPQNNILRVIVRGKTRAAIDRAVSVKPFLKAAVYEKKETAVKSSNTDYETALIRRAKKLFEEYATLTPKLAPDIFKLIESADASGRLADTISANIFLDTEIKQQLLSVINPLKRLEKLCVVLLNEIKLLRIEDDINDKVQEQMDKNQQDYFLREQMRVISEELGDSDGEENETDELADKIRKLKTTDENKTKLLTECSRMRRLQPSSPDANVIRTYLERCIALPWGKYTKDNLNLAHARKVLDRDHFGLTDVKQRIIEMLAARAVSPDIKGQIICLAGPPGVGKTSIAKSIAAAMGRNYRRISLGGVRDEAEIRGHRRTYIGAIPGRIITALTDAKSANALILLDEIDKLGGDFRGDPASALLEALDAEQNNAFTDHYIELPFDLSQVLFITTANNRDEIPDALLDRMEVIELYSYTLEEKFNIAKKHLIKKQMKEHNITREKLKITDKALRLIIDGYTREAGVRKLEREIAKICRKVTVKIAEGDTAPVTVNENNVESFLGARKFRDENASFLNSEIGLANGLAWTSVGGEMLQIETAVLDGTGKIELTGSLGDVMKESAHAAVTYVRSHADELNIDKDFYKTKDIHIHVPEGAVPKDGPSAGITMTTSLVSALSHIPVNGHIAMTGEVTLRGRVLPIGGLKEKSMAAFKTGIDTVIIPDGNVPDIEKIDDAVKGKIKFRPVKTVDDVLNIALKKD